MENLTQEKTLQAISILQELGIDLWLTFVRETSTSADPVLPLIYGHELTWQSVCMISRYGDRIAIVGNFETETARRTNSYDKVIGYHESLKPDLLRELEIINPGNIAINYSQNDVNADGLSLGLFQILSDYLVGTPWENSLISAERIISALKGRKTYSEIERVRKAVSTTEKIFQNTFEFVRPGMTEADIAAFMQEQLTIRGLQPAWEIDHCPTVNAGPDSPVGHVSVSDITLKNGQILHIDFGVKQNEYCSDIQRVAYVLAEGEIEPPMKVQHGFRTIVDAIQKCVDAIKPGFPGHQIDNIARDSVVQAGYPEYKYATGHQLGRLAHDGAGLIGPLWERYRNTPNYLLEEGQIFTIEPGLALPGYGYIGIEEDVIITGTGCEFLSNPQVKMVLI